MLGAIRQPLLVLLLRHRSLTRARVCTHTHTRMHAGLGLGPWGYKPKFCPSDGHIWVEVTPRLTGNRRQSAYSAAEARADVCRGGGKERVS